MILKVYFQIKDKQILMQWKSKIGWEEIDKMKFFALCIKGEKLNFMFKYLRVWRKNYWLL